MRELRQAGNLENLRAVAQPGSAVAEERAARGEAAGEYKGRYPFLDTDVFKALEGVAYEIGRGAADGETRAFFEEAVALIESAQRADGYLNSYFQAETVDKEPWEDLAWGHELYNLGHLIQAAVAASRQLGDRRLLDVAVRFADLTVQKLGPAGENAVDGHPEIEMALVELFRETGNRGYLELAQLFVDRRGHGTVQLRVFPAEYFQDNAPFRELDSVTGHAVRMAYLAAGATDVAVETGDETLLAASRRLWDDMVRTKLYITGGLGSRHSDEAIGDRYELPSERSYSETCAAIATMQWGWRLFLATGQAHYLDTFETVLYNAYAAGLSSDGCAFFYDNPLQRRPDHQQRTGAEPDGEILRRAWFVCPCCPPNIIRWMSELQDHVAVVDSDGGSTTVYLTQYAASQVRVGGLGFEISTAYPFEGDVSIRVSTGVGGPAAGSGSGDGTAGWGSAAAEAASGDAPADAASDAVSGGAAADALSGGAAAAESPDAPRITLALRVPGWCRSARVSVNGEALEVATVDGWMRVARVWVDGDTVDLRLDMPVRAHGSHPAVDGTRGALAVARGPLVFAAEQQDNSVPLDDVIVRVEDVRRAHVVPAGLDGHAPSGSVAIILPARVSATEPDAPLYPELRDDRDDHPALTTDEAAGADASTQLALVPYYLWGNRDPLTMRVWLRRDIPSVTTERK